MFHQNAQHTGLSPFVGPAIPFLKWSFQTGGAIYASAAIGLGRIYVGSDDGNLYALNLQGRLLWKFQTGFVIRTSPAIGSDGTVYLAGCLKCYAPIEGILAGCQICAGRGEGILYSINPSGKLNWNVTIIPIEEGSLSSPTIGPDETIYVSDVGFHISAIRPDGTIKWELNTFGEVFDSPALAPDGTIYIGIDDPDPSGLCSQCLLALNPDGTVKWGALPHAVTFSSPAVGSDGTVYIGGDAVNPGGTVKWHYPGPYTSPSIGPDGAIYTSGAGGLYALNPDGTLRWKFPTGEDAAFCVPSGNCSFVSFVQTTSSIGSDGIIYLASGSYSFDYRSYPNATFLPGNLYAIRPNGALAWKFTIGPVFGSDPLAIGFDGTIYVGSVDGNLYAIG